MGGFVIVSWQVIGLIIAIILIVLGGSPQILGIISFFLVVSQILFVLFGIVSLLSCWFSPKHIIGKIFCTLLIIFISVALVWGTNDYNYTLITLFDDNILSYLISLIFGGIEYLIYSFSGSYAVVSLGSEDNDDLLGGIISTGVFLFMFNAVCQPF